MKFLSYFKKPVLKILSPILLLMGVVLGKTTSAKIQETPSVRERIAAVQKAIRQMPEKAQAPQILSAQWGNWANWANWLKWNNWNNWNNWAKWLKWGNWGNWGNY